MYKDGSRGLLLLGGLSRPSPVAPSGDTINDLNIAHERGVEGGRDEEENPVRDVIFAPRSLSKILVKAGGGGR